jgi:bla regulator protein blaR1
VEGVLKVCEFYLESPLACAAGGTGSDMKKRIQAIVNRRIGKKLTRMQNVCLAMALGAALTAPIILGLLFTPISSAQTQTGSKPFFAVSSVKLNASGAPVFDSTMEFQPGGRFVATNKSFSSLTAFAYGVRRVIGGPDWINSDYWDIDARAEEGTVSSNAASKVSSASNLMNLMLQALLENRFQLKAHREIREYPAYELIIAPGGLKIKRSEDQSPPKPVDPSSRPKSLPGNQIPAVSRGGYLATIGYFEADDLDVSLFPPHLRVVLGRTIIDKTGLKGRYDIKLQYRPEMGQTGVRVEGESSPFAPESSFPLPSIFTAIQEQLGLKLEPTKEQVEVVVIDSIQKPAEN